jgi:hypothetical protein
MSIRSLILAWAPTPAFARSASAAAAVLALTLTLTLALTGCLDRGYTFATTAAYDVPALGIRVDLAAQGTVAPGADLSDDGTFTAVLTRKGAPTIPVATLQSTNQVIRYGLGTNLTSSLPWGSIDTEPSTRKLMNDLGFTNDVPAVFDEFSRVLSGAAFGPKSTVVGSSTNILVVKMKRDFQR